MIESDRLITARSNIDEERQDRTARHHQRRRLREIRRLRQSGGTRARRHG